MKDQWPDPCEHCSTMAHTQEVVRGQLSVSMRIECVLAKLGPRAASADRPTLHLLLVSVLPTYDGFFNCMGNIFL